MAEWCAEPSAPTSCALGCSDQGCSWKLVPAHAAGSPGCSWHQDQLRLGCRAPSWQPGKSLSHHSHRWERQARPVWLSISNASLGTGTVSGRKEDLLFVAVLKEGGGESQTQSPFRQSGPLEINQMCLAKARSAPHFPQTVSAERKMGEMEKGVI